MAQIVEWINKIDNLPPIGGFGGISNPVIVTDGKYIGYGCFDYNRVKWVYELVGYSETDDNAITHWMPLLKLPE